MIQSMLINYTHTCINSIYILLKLNNNNRYVNMLITNKYFDFSKKIKYFQKLNC